MHEQSVIEAYRMSVSAFTEEIISKWRLRASGDNTWKALCTSYDKCLINGSCYY